MNVTPHVAWNNKRAGGSAIDGSTSRRAGYQVRQRGRKRAEEPFGWGKSGGLTRQMKCVQLVHNIRPRCANKAHYALTLSE